MVNGEIDRIIMNCFQQLLWEPSHVWKEKGQSETTNNLNATKLASDHGKEQVHKYLIEKMNDQWGINH